MTEDMSSQDTTAVETAENTVETVVGNADEQASNQEVPSDFEPLTATYERLRHSTDAAELSEFARRPLPDRSEQAAFSRATALLEAVAGNAHTPLEDRVFLRKPCRFRIFSSNCPPTNPLRCAKLLRAMPMIRIGWWGVSPRMSPRSARCRVAQQADVLEDAARRRAGSGYGFHGP